ncbi:tetratricopeptide repeat protein [Phenylobacterium sp.]|uniref:tetratricopeptide repeat protein n=1 Tax=Phenylobacterium sp. TaxID=1871053 RepID=UPI002E31A7E4|nr:tetratricopeptide repeat protein [Phenylobacterium sp.]HEX2561485.1 tetratricopeptide repeat protein [Phenylobacterium sp.]
MAGRFLSELKRRNVIRVGGVYLVTAWALFGIAKTIFEVMGFPKWTSPLLLVLLALGLPIATIIAWAFERAPEGGVRRTEAPPEDAPPLKFGLFDGALLAAIGGVLVITVLQVTGLFGGAARVPLLPSEEKSVAVLPFASFSTRPEMEFFADGLTEEVINSLAKVEDLKVAGRTSAFYFKGKNEDLREIGKKLGVAHVVEGSVRHDGDRLRVTAQLIKVSDGFHLWSETYDRDMSDAFVIQTEIAEAVAEALKAELDAGDKTRASRRNPEAYELELTSRAQLRHLGLAQLTAAHKGFKRLIELEPNNPEGYAGLAQASALLVQHHLQGDFRPTIREAETAIAKALELDPKSASAYIARGWVNRMKFIRASCQSCEGIATASFKRAAELEPRNPEALSLYGADIAIARPAEAITYLRRALAIDPLDKIAQTYLSEALAATGDFAAAERQYRTAAELFPDFIDTKQNLAGFLIVQGKLDEAEPWLRAAAQPGTDPSAGLELAHLYLNLGLRPDMAATVEQLKSSPVAAEVANAVTMITDGQYQELLAHSRKFLVQPEPDPIWHAIGFSAAALAGDYEFAREQLLIIHPELFEPEPQVSASAANEVVAAAFVIAQLGDQGQSRRILDETLRVTEPTPGRWQSHARRIARMKAFAMMGDNERALAELRAAIDAGYRTLYDMDVFLRLDTYPMLAPLRGDPRFQAMIREIEADVAKKREAVLARRRGAPPAQAASRAAA